MSETPHDRSSDPLIEPEDVDSEPLPQSATPDPNDEIPVPIAMFPSEIDERAQVVETLRNRDEDEDTAEGDEPRADGT